MLRIYQLYVRYGPNVKVTLSISRTVTLIKKKTRHKEKIERYQCLSSHGVYTQLENGIRRIDLAALELSDNEAELSN